MFIWLLNVLLEIDFRNEKKCRVPIEVILKHICVAFFACNFSFLVLLDSATSLEAPLLNVWLQLSQKLVIPLVM